MNDSTKLPAGTPTGIAASALLSVKSLSVSFKRKETSFQAVKSLSFEVLPGKTTAIVGESGSGKSVTSLAIMRLVDHVRGRITAGSMLFQPRSGKPIDLAAASSVTLRQIRGNEIAMIFQEPMTSLNPVFPIGKQITETIILHQGLDPTIARDEARLLLEKVRLPDAERLLDRYPHQLSGGMRQRVMIAMALSCRPRLLIADEPTTALDVTTQSQILDIIRTLQREMGMSVIFITHDMGVVAEVADQVVVMRRGAKVEEAKVADIFTAPRHPYTKVLLASVPRLGSTAGSLLPHRSPVMVLRGEEAEPIGVSSPQDTADYREPIVTVDRLTTRFPVGRDFLGRTTHCVHAVEQVSFDIYPGETLGLVGESGSGKSTLGRTLQQLVSPLSGTLRVQGRDVAAMTQTERRKLRQTIQYIFQDPFASLDPRKKVGYSIAEPILIHRLLQGRDPIRARVAELLQLVGLNAADAEHYPHEFSGGQRQRIGIARALSCDPSIIIADEAVSALDVSIQAQILDLLMDLQHKRGLAYLFISHDMAVVEKISHRVAVMYLGQIVEIGPRRAVFEDPHHSYTKRLLAAVPVADPRHVRTKPSFFGEIPSAVRALGHGPAIVHLHQIAPGHLAAVEST